MGYCNEVQTGKYIGQNTGFIGSEITYDQGCSKLKLYQKWNYRDFYLVLLALNISVLFEITVQLEQKLSLINFYGILDHKIRIRHDMHNFDFDILIQTNRHWNIDLLYFQTTIKVYTGCLRLDIEYKTLGIRWDTTSKDIVTQILRRYWFFVCIVKVYRTLWFARSSE